jgi:hypothetical protein
MKLHLNRTISKFRFTVANICYTEGIQKINGGFSRGSHHTNSIRLGVNRSFVKEPLFYAYTYVQGKQISLKLGHLPVGEDFICELWLRKDSIGAEIYDLSGNLIYTNCLIHPTPIKLCCIGYDLNQYFEKDGENVESQMTDINGNETNFEVWKI